MADDLQKPPKSDGADLYERDYLAWTEVQAAALRAGRGGENALDYDNLAEEIEDLGKSVVRACESQVENIIEHLLKIEFVGPLQTIPHWRKEIRGFRRELDKQLTPSIKNRIIPETAETFAYVVKALADGELIASRDAIFSLLQSYEWDRIVDPDWYPSPRYRD